MKKITLKNLRTKRCKKYHEEVIKNYNYSPIHLNILRPKDDCVCKMENEDVEDIAKLILIPSKFTDCDWWVGVSYDDILTHVNQEKEDTNQARNIIQKMIQDHYLAQEKLEEILYVFPTEKLLEAMERWYYYAENGYVYNP